MRRIREVLRLKYECGLTNRQIATTQQVGRVTVAEYLHRAEEAGLRWPLPEGLDDTELERRLFRLPLVETTGRRAQPDWPRVHAELRRPGVTLFLLWQEYRADHSDGYQYSQFCNRYRHFAGGVHPTMRQVHRAGEKAFVDFSGKRPEIVDPKTGEVRPVELFVGVLGASSRIYAEATWDQSLPNWIRAHVRMVEAWGGSPAIFVPDNLKSGVTRACRYEPDLNRTYEDFARFYGAAVIPARPYRPRDKAKVEVSVLLAQRWILAVLRNRTFFSLAELNAAIWELLEALNDRPMQKLGVSRRELFERLDRPALRRLPPHRYEFAEWKTCVVNIDYHIEVDHNLYSVPYQLYRQKVEARFTLTTVEVFDKNRRVASHQRLRGRGRASTVPEHMPRSHRAHAEWTPSRLISWAEKTGPQTARLVEEILRNRAHPEQGYRACLGIMRLGQAHGSERLEAASHRACQLQAFSYRTIKNILTAGMDRLPLEEEDTLFPSLPVHHNIRGAEYYAAPKEESRC